MTKLFKRSWIPIVIIVVVLIGAFSVHRIRGFFGEGGIIVTPRNFADDAKPFNPKVVKYEIFGTGSVATINYLDLDAQPQKAENATLPWALTLTTTAPAASPNIVAQSDGNTISCRITVDGVVRDERTSDGVNAQTFCLVKSA